jgi:hypothetical protein
MANAIWFKNTFDLSSLSKNSKKKTAPPPEFLFDIDGTRSLKTIHECISSKSAANPKPKNEFKVAIDLGSDCNDSDSDSTDFEADKDEDFIFLSSKGRLYSQASKGAEHRAPPTSSDEVNGSA